MLVSLIIPSHNADIKLHELLRGIPNWERVPNEIIIVDSSEKESIIPKDIELSIKKLNVDLLIIYEKGYLIRLLNLEFFRNLNLFAS